MRQYSLYKSLYKPSQQIVLMDELILNCLKSKDNIGLDDKDFLFVSVDLIYLKIFTAIY